MQSITNMASTFVKNPLTLGRSIENDSAQKQPNAQLLQSPSLSKVKDKIVYTHYCFQSLKQYDRMTKAPTLPKYCGSPNNLGGTFS
jgi:hypothetical protein